MVSLKPREYYEDIYDKGTVDQCRLLRDHKLKVTDKDIEDAKLTPSESAKIQEVKGLWINVVQEMQLSLLLPNASIIKKPGLKK